LTDSFHYYTNLPYRVIHPCTLNLFYLSGEITAYISTCTVKVYYWSAGEIILSKKQTNTETYDYQCPLACAFINIYLSTKTHWDNLHWSKPI